MLSLITLQSSFPFYSYQKDELALPGDLRTKRCFTPSKINCLSLLPHSFLLAPALLLTCTTPRLLKTVIQIQASVSKVTAVASHSFCVETYLSCTYLLLHVYIVTYRVVAPCSLGCGPTFRRNVLPVPSGSK
jgi:hypothetical protein